MKEDFFVAYGFKSLFKCVFVFLVFFEHAFGAEAYGQLVEEIKIESNGDVLIRIVENDFYDEEPSNVLDLCEYTDSDGGVFNVRIPSTTDVKLRKAWTTILMQATTTYHLMDPGSSSCDSDYDYDNNLGVDRCIESHVDFVYTAGSSSCSSEIGDMAVITSVNSSRLERIF